jgi:hypothetical protein
MPVLLTVCLALVAVIYLYDAKRALWPMLPGEQAGRRGRVAGTTMALIAMCILQRGAGPLWARPIAVLALLLSLAVVLRYSILLKGLVAGALLYRREGYRKPG